MKKGISPLTFLLAVLASSAFLSSSSLSAQSRVSDTVRIYYLGGQSNMNGFGYNKDLPGSLKKINQDIWIFHGNPVGDDLPMGGLGIWAPLQAGHGTGFSSDGIFNRLSDRFGVELSLASRLQELYPGTAMKNSDIDGDGKQDILVPAGIVWMQGESDAGFTEEIARRYYFNLKRLMDLIRASFHSDDLPVVLGKISDSWDDPNDGKVWDHAELVQYAQERYARTDGNAAIVRETRYYKYSDSWHYDSEGYVDLGKRFAEALYKLEMNL